MDTCWSSDLNESLMMIFGSIASLDGLVWTALGDTDCLNGSRGISLDTWVRNDSTMDTRTHAAGMSSGGCSADESRWVFPVGVLGLKWV